MVNEKNKRKKSSQNRISFIGLAFRLNPNLGESNSKQMLHKNLIDFLPMVGPKMLSLWQKHELLVLSFADKSY